MKTKAAKFFSCCKYELIIFAVLFVQTLINLFSFGGVGEYTSVYYLSDYSIGINSRLLIGSIVGLINDKPTIEWITGMAVVVLMLTLLAVSVLTGKVVRNTEQELRPQLYVLIAFMVLSSFTFGFFSNYLGSLDIYTLIVGMIAVICTFSKKTRWLVPFLCVAGVLVHNIFIITYFPMVFLVMFYFLIKENGRAYTAAMLVISLIATAALTIYFTAYAGDNMSITFDEFRKIINEKSSVEILDAGLYGIGFHLFNIVGEEVVEGFTLGDKIDLSFTELVKGFMQFIKASATIDGAVPVIIVDVLVLSAFWVIWTKCVKNAESKGGKLVYISFILVSLISVVSFFVALDYVRWIQAVFITQFAFCLLLFNKKDEAFLKTMQQLREYFSDKKLLVAVILVIYTFIIQRVLS